MYVLHVPFEEAINGQYGGVTEESRHKIKWRKVKILRRQNVFGGSSKT